jgi:hypothetical protein
VLVLVLAVTVAIDLVWPWWPWGDDESVAQTLLERGFSTLFVGGAVILEREWRSMPDRRVSKADDTPPGASDQSWPE